MLDIQFIRNNPDLVAEKSKQKGYDVDIQQLLGFDSKRRSLLREVEDLRRQRKEIAENTQNSRPSEEQIHKGSKIRKQLADLEHQLSAIEQEFATLLKQVPNMPSDDVPIGRSEDDNVTAKTVGEPPKFEFTPKNHWEIAEKRMWIDKERAAKVVGSRFAYIKGDLVRLHWALMQFGLKVLGDELILKKIIEDNQLDVSSRPFTPVLPPLMLKTDIYEAMDRLDPRDDRYKIEGEELWLQGSAEHVLGSMHAGEMFDNNQLPIRYAGYATSFRKEAGTYGKDTKGIIRMHQFDKLEMESISHPDSSLNEHLLMIAIQEYLMQQLELPYRVINKCTADIGKPNARGWDLEVWLPGQNKYRETHTADYMTDYQARRLKMRVRTKEDGQSILAHTNDATVFSQRPLIAIIENFQTVDGGVVVPKVLRPWIDNRDSI